MQHPPNFRHVPVAGNKNGASTEVMMISGTDAQELKLFIEEQKGNAGPQHEK